MANSNLNITMLLWFLLTMCGVVKTSQGANDLLPAEKIDSLYFEGREALYIDPSKTIILMEEAWKIALLINDTKKKGDVLHLAGSGYRRLGKNKKALNNYLEALKWREKASDKVGKAKTLNNIGIIFNNLTQYEYALKYYIKAANLHTKLGNLQFAAETHRNIGIAYLRLSENKKARNAFFSALKIYKNSSLNANDEIARLYNELGRSFFADNDKKAIEYLQKAIGINNSLKSDIDLGVNYSNLAFVYEKQGNIEQSQKLYNVSTKHFLRSSDYEKNGFLAENYICLGRNALKMEKFNEAIKNLNKAEQYAIKSRHKKALISCYDEFMLAYQKSNNTLSSLAYSEKAIKARDAFYTDELIQKADAAELIQLENTFALRQQREANQASLVALEQNKQLLYVFLVALLGMGGLALLFYHRKNIFQRLNQEKYHAVGAIAHDLRSPLNHISGLLDVLPLAKNDSERDQYVLLARRRATQLSDLIAKTLDLNKLELGEVNISCTHVRLEKILDEVIGEFKKDAEKKCITINFQCNNNTSIYADEHYIRQIYQNLISNAIKFSPIGKHIYIELFNDNGKVRVSIKDEGPGLNKNDKKKLFQHFAKLSSKPTGGEPSTGLGLTIVKKYVELMNGIIWCESDSGKGATFITEFKQAA